MLSYIFTPGLLQCCLCVAALFMKPLPKRKNFSARLGISAVLCLLCAAPLSAFHSWASVAARQLSAGTEAAIAAASGVEMLLYLLVVTAFFAVCCDIDLLRAAYCAACAYLTQDLAYTIFVFFRPASAHRGRSPRIPEDFWLELLILILYSLLFYRLIAKRILVKGEEPKSCWAALGYMIAVLFIGRTLGTLASIGFTGAETKLFRILLLYDILLSASLLVAQVLIFRQSRYRRELAMESQLRQQQYQQFVLFQESVDSIRHKCHDLKHMIAALQQEGGTGQNRQLLQEMQTAVTRYDTSINTGNNTLDALLSKTWNSCEQRSIQWTCMADGAALDFMDPFDLYILLGNALDNAVECLTSIPEPEKRFLSVNIRRKGGLALLCLRNYCDHALNFEQGLPVTTKAQKEEHGYGTRSIREIAEKYNGQMSVKVEQNIFTLNIMLPIPQ